MSNVSMPLRHPVFDVIAINVVVNVRDRIDPSGTGLAETVGTLNADNKVVSAGSLSPRHSQPCAHNWETQRVAF